MLRGLDLRLFVVLLIVVCEMLPMWSWAESGPLWESKLQIDDFLSTAEKKEIDKSYNRENFGYEKGIFYAAYVEYKLSRQMAKGYHQKALRNFNESGKKAVILNRRLGLYRNYHKGGMAFGVLQQSCFLSIKKAIFGRKKPELFYDLLQDFQKAWFAH